MKPIELKRHSVAASIDPRGAWLTTLSDNGDNILYPKTSLAALDGSQKTRGGCHVCLPNFGPGGESGLAQHGFGRVLSWQVGSQLSSTVILWRKGGAPGYEGLTSQLTYHLDEKLLVMNLELQNEGETALAVSPAFHPYFALPAGVREVIVGDTDGTSREYDVAKLGGTEFVSGSNRLVVKLGERDLVLESTNLPVWAIWTDQLGQYVCVEPTAAGNAFVDGEPQQLVPGESSSHTLTIRW